MSGDDEGRDVEVSRPVPFRSEERDMSSCSPSGWSECACSSECDRLAYRLFVGDENILRS